MWPTLSMLGVMLFTWVVAMYATNSEEPAQQPEPAKNEKAA